MRLPEERLERLLERLDDLARRAERLLPPAGETDWSALAFRWRRPGWLQPVRHPHGIHLRDLQHIDRQKQALVRNTEKFLRGAPANHALLWGARGTGKSSLVKALLQDYAMEGLRLIEVDKHDLADLPDITEPLHARPERFILFSDDLSFDASEPGYKALKAALDGSVAALPDNVLIYATSNRRHLMPEFHSENRETRVHDGELHFGESVEEKISLSERFGLWLAFHPFNQKQYLDTVAWWFERLQIRVDDPEDMVRAALRFALQRGSRSGRVARQFVTHWASEPLHPDDD